MTSTLNPLPRPVPFGHGTGLNMANPTHKLPPIQAPSAQPSFHTGNPYESSSTATTLSPRSPNGATPNSALPSAPRSADARSYPQPPGPPSSENVPRYAAEYDPMMVSPPGYDQFRGPRMEMLGGSPHAPHGIPGSSLQQKRVYRQRRKDPSCDACRERKVKCDATDTSSCSECSSRNVKCQFTKETNRRMSSIKQVQDLEKQLFTAKQQLSRYEDAFRSKGLPEAEGVAIEDEESAVGAASPSKRRKIRSARDDVVVPKLDERMGSLLRIIASEEVTDEPQQDKRPDLDPESAAQAVSSFSRSAIAEPRFMEAVSAKYVEQAQERSSAGDTEAAGALAVIYGCLACDALQSKKDMAESYHRALEAHINFGNPSLDTVRAALLSAIYLSELRRPEKAFMRLGLAVIVAQSIGLQCRTDSTPGAIETQRRQLWAAIICWERSLSLEYGRPSLIQDDDLAAGIEDGPPNDISDSQSGMKRVAKIAGEMAAAFKEDIVPAAPLASLDQALFLTPSDEQDAPGVPWANIHTLSARLLLHRHHITPATADEVWRGAADACAGIAAETAGMLEHAERRLRGKGDERPDAFVQAVGTGPAAKVIIHLWRCAILALFAGDVRTALACARLLASLDGVRPVARRCGAHLAAFADLWRRRTPAIPCDPELITAASADAQTCHTRAWVRDLASGAGAAAGPDRALPNGAHSEWNGWKDLLDALAQLPQPSPPAVSGSEMPAADMGVPGAQPARVDAGGSAASSSRMKIADLMG